MSEINVNPEAENFAVESTSLQSWPINFLREWKGGDMMVGIPFFYHSATSDNAQNCVMSPWKLL